MGHFSMKIKIFLKNGKIKAFRLWISSQNQDSFEPNSGFSTGEA
jgi:hypothetical protein